ncbi:hypothetical protein HDU98_004247 [Podochytrium sp. JEL0797]|nr:hypothetical protein HDU98_004247 [Podochytrium sp. JEL0797]
MHSLEAMNAHAVDEFFRDSLAGSGQTGDALDVGLWQHDLPTPICQTPFANATANPTPMIIPSQGFPERRSSQGQKITKPLPKAFGRITPSQIMNVSPLQMPTASPLDPHLPLLFSPITTQFEQPSPQTFAFFDNMDASPMLQSHIEAEIMGFSPQIFGFTPFIGPSGTPSSLPMDSHINLLASPMPFQVNRTQQQSVTSSPIMNRATPMQIMSTPMSAVPLPSPKSAPVNRLLANFSPRPFASSNNTSSGYMSAQYLQQPQQPLTLNNAALPFPDFTTTILPSHRRNTSGGTFQNFAAPLPSSYSIPRRSTSNVGFAVPAPLPPLKVALDFSSNPALAAPSRLTPSSLRNFSTSEEVFPPAAVAAAMIPQLPSSSELWQKLSPPESVASPAEDAVNNSTALALVDLARMGVPTLATRCDVVQAHPTNKRKPAVSAENPKPRKRPNSTEQREYRKSAEKQRRDAMRDGFESIKSLTGVVDKSASKEQLLGAALEYIAVLQNGEREKEAVSRCLEREIWEMKRRMGSL